jgi:DNA-binding Lrp family transcriptional regulator
MDDLDHRLIAALRRDGRASLSDLAAELGATRSTLRLRLARLMESGEIAGFSAITRADVSPAPVRGFMMIAIEGRGAERIIARLQGFPSVMAVHSTNGKWDVILELAAQSLADLDRVLHRIRDLDGITTSETNLVLATRLPGRN